MQIIAFKKKKNNKKALNKRCKAYVIIERETNG